MKVRQCLWWVIGGVFLLFCVGFVLAAYRFEWSSTGFLSKSLWDWLQLLIVPLVLAIIALVFQRASSRTEQQIAKDRYDQDRETAKQRYEQDQQIALDKQREDLLQTYLDRLSELLLKEDLLQSAPNSKVRNVARVRTVTVLFQLDARRIGYVFEFLRESGLMSNQPNKSIVSLSNADLKEVNFVDADLDEADLSGANLSKANLSFASLYEANLSGAKLSEANLSFASLYEANLSGAKLSEANLKEADLSFVSLDEATLSNADLTGATLSNADLSFANLYKANLSGVNLDGANLKDATYIITEKLEKQAKSLKEAIMPDGTIRP